MRKRSLPLRWLGSLRSSFVRDSQARATRRVRLEQLEQRYVLTAPIAHDDGYFAEKNTPYSADSSHGLLANDEGNPGLFVSSVNGIAANVGSTISLGHGGHVTVNSDGSFSFTPATDFDGHEDFTYQIGNGSGFDDGAVTINVNPQAFQLNSYAVMEGHDDLVLQDAGSAGTGLSYYWRIDTAPVDPTQSEFDPLVDSRVLVGQNPSVTWAQLNAWGIYDATTSAVVTLKIKDSAGQVDYAQANLTVLDVLPAPTSFTITPASSAGCGGATVTLDAVIKDDNPAEVVTSVFVDWNWDLFNPVTPELEPHPDQELPVSPGPNGTFVVHFDHDYGAPGDQFPYLFINAHNPISGNDEAGAGLYLAPTATGQAQIRTANTELNVSAPNDGFPVDDYTWSVTKDGQPFMDASPGNAVFPFTPIDAGIYVTHVVENHNSTFPGFTQAFDDTYVVVSSGGAVHADISGAPTSNVLPTLAIDLSNGGSTCGAVTYAWSVTKDGSPFATGSNSTFSFTPDNVGTYVVSLTVSGATSDTDTKTINVVRSISDGTTFMVGESNAADNVVLHASDIPAGTQKVVIYAGDGNDDIQVPGSLSIPVWIYGGPGNDRIKGGAGNDVIIGGDGDDLLMGGSGRDLLIGGNGQDRIIGDADDDILIAGWTDFDNDPATLSLIMSEWTSATDNFLIRCVALNGVLQNDGPNATVHDDDNQDTLTGASGTDWYFANLFLDNGDDANTRDRITDLNLLELLFVQDIDFIETDVT